LAIDPLPNGSVTLPFDLFEIGGVNEPCSFLALRNPTVTDNHGSGTTGIALHRGASTLENPYFRKWL
jgi:hypothetical protein